MPGLHLYTSNRMERLVEKLAKTLQPPLPSPFDEEIIVVQSNGMERWVRMMLARRHGICAHVAFPFPNAMVEAILRDALPEFQDDAPFDPALLRWGVMKTLPAVLHHPAFAEVRAYLGEPVRPIKLFQLSERIADTFDQYLVFRPGMILAWEKGSEAHWQAVLWRTLTGTYGNAHRAAMREAFFRRLDAHRPSSNCIPGRFAVFGISALPPYHMGIFEAVSRDVDVNLFIMNPCREYWMDIVSDRQMTKILDGRDPTRPDTAALHLERGNSLLASMGKMGRDFLELMADVQVLEEDRFVEIEPRNLLTAVQSDIFNLVDRGDGSAEPTRVSDDDRSIQIHSCHSPMREMEVLYDNLLVLFEKDSTLEPKDILVMAPDIETYAPYIKAVFGEPEEGRSRLPFTMADRNAVQEGLLAQAFLGVLALSDGRFEASGVLGLLECDPVRQRFAMTEEDLLQVHRWVRESGISWGVDAQDRARLNLPPFEENTWRFGLDRLILGYALPKSDDQTFEGILPCEDIEGGEAPLLGRLTAFVEALEETLRDVRTPRSLAEWRQTLLNILEALFAATESVVTEMQMLRAAIESLGTAQELARFNDAVDLEVVRSHLRGRIEKGSFGLGFMTGGVTFCSMLPMRSIPCETMCLIGMNNDAYPRQIQKPGFDLMAKSPTRGDRSRRDDDRYLFLEAILSARKTLYISYVGQDPQDNTPIPPSVLVSELTDYIDKAFIPCSPMAERVSEQCVTAHRLQAFSPSYFQGRKGLRSYSEENFEGALRLMGDPAPSQPFLPDGLPEPSSGWKTIEIGQLVAFYRNPCAFLLKERLGVYLEEDEERIPDSEPYSLEGLERYHLEQELLERGMAGVDLTSSYPWVRAGGRLPHGCVGEVLFEDIRKGVEAFLTDLRGMGEGPSLPCLDLEITLSDLTLTGHIPEIRAGGSLLYRYAQAKAKDHVKAWIQHLFLNAASPSPYPRTTWLLAKDGLWEYAPVPDASVALRALLDLFVTGLRKPVPFFPQVSMKYAHALAVAGTSEKVALERARAAWEGNDYSPGECQDPYYGVCYRHSDPLNSEFTALAVAVYEPLLKARRLLRKR